MDRHKGLSLANGLIEVLPSGFGKRLVAVMAVRLDRFQ
jgi:hypothetical protein